MEHSFCAGLSPERAALLPGEASPAWFVLAGSSFLSKLQAAAHTA
jgi:hypothetical protein